MKKCVSFRDVTRLRSTAFSVCCLLLALSRTAFSASPPQTFTDSDGDAYVVRLTGPGSAVVTIDDPDTDTRGPISSLALAGTDSTSVLTVAVTKVGDGRVKIGAITGIGAVNIISAPACDLNGAGISLGGATHLRLGDIAAGANIVLPTRTRPKPLAVSARDVGAMQLTAPGSTLTFLARSVSGGAKISAPVIAAFNVTAGNCAADISTPGRLVSLSVKGGDFIGHISAASIGSIRISKSSAGTGGSLRDSVISARTIGTLIVTRDLVNTLVLAGAKLGADSALGGTGVNADTFGPGSIGTVLISGSMTNSIAGGGFTPLDGKFGDANDGTLGGRIAAFTVRGQMDSLSRIGATVLPSVVFINRIAIRTRRDVRFISRKVIIPPPPVAVPLSETSALPAAAATSFLYTGPSAVQTGVAPGAIKREAAAVLRGRVIGREALPLAGVEISVLDHPEFGKTNSRADGMFDMAVNGGGRLIVRFEAPGLCPLQRQIDPTRQDFSVLGDVVMIGVDGAMTEVALGAAAPMQMHEATMQTDASGPRHAALMFQPGTSATLLMPDGTTKPAPSLSVRATEFTVGPSGPSAMPGTLPPNSAYTYCAELSADEADAAGATTVMFDKPVYFYVENFLHFDIGIDVPSGLYDKTKGVWEAGPSGRIVKIVSITAGAVNLDVDGDGNVDTGAALTALNITAEERAQLATSYPAGTSLWRVPIPHFSPWDFNWPFSPPPDAGPPGGGPPSGGDQPPNEPDCCEGSIVEVQAQVLGESVGITGTPFSLNYRSNRVPGRKAADSISIPLSGATIPASVKRIEMEVNVAGRTFTQDFAAGANVTATFAAWDGTDAYGRETQGRQSAKVRIGYVYDGDYQRANRFGYNGNGIAITGDRTRQEITLSKEASVLIGPFDLTRQSVGGWTLDVHHVYDSASRTLYLGDGGTRTAGSVNAIIQTVAGSGELFTAGFNNDGIPATSGRTLRPAFLAVGPDGSFYYPDADIQQIYRVGPDGIQHVIAGIAGSAGYNGDERSARTAQLNAPFGIALGPDGTVYFNDGNNRRTRSITPDGIIHTVAGTGVDGYSGDGGPATAARIGVAINLSYAADGSLYISDSNKHAIRRVGTDGIITTVAGTGVRGFSGDGGLATAAQLGFPLGAAADAEGNLFIVDSENRRIRKVSASGIITTIGGDGTGAAAATDAAGDGGPAILAKIGVDRPGFILDPNGLRVDPQGNILFADAGLHRVRRISRDGIITSLAGSGNVPVTPSSPNGDGGAALQAKFVSPTDVDFGPDGSIYTIDVSTFAVRRAAPPLPGFSGGEIAIASENGAQLYRFDAGGRHLSTVNTFTGATVFTFSYDADGQLVRITDGDKNVTTILRNAAGSPLAIVAPFGQRTTLAADANGYLTSVTAPALPAHTFTYDAGGGGLLTGETDPGGRAHTFTYDTAGRLTKDDAPGAAFTDFERVGIPRGYFVTGTTALGAVGKVQVENLANGAELRTNTDAAGLITTDSRAANGVNTTTKPHGTVETTTLGPDPRFAMQAPTAAKQTIATPGGKTLTKEIVRTVTQTDPQNPLSLTAFRETTKVNNRASTLDFDKATGTVTATSPLNRLFTTKIDAQSRPVQVIAGNLTPRNLTYDANGRLSTLATGSGAQQRLTRVAYNTEGFPASVTDALGQSERYRYDAAARISLVTSTGGKAMGLGYDALGQVTSITPPGRAAHLFTHTLDGEIASYTAPDAGSGVATTASTYNADGQLTTTLLPGGALIAFDYDAGGRLTKRTVPGNATTIALSPTTGLRTSLTETNGDALTFTYDGALPTGLTWSGTVAGSVTRTIDHDFRTAAQSVNGASTVSFTYDADGKVIAIGALTLEREAALGRIAGSQLAGVSDARTFDALGQTTGFSAKFGAATNLFSAAHTRDKLGRITESVETLASTPADTFTYAYDADGQLLSVKKNGVTQNSYTYDTNGNRLTDGAVSATYDAQDRLTQRGGTAYTYQPGGERLTRSNAGGTTTYSHDALGNLLSVTLPGGSVVSYLADGEGRRIGRKLNGTLVQGFLYSDDLRIVAELDGGNALVSRFVYGDRENVPSYMVKGGVTYRLVADTRGSVRLVVNAATGSIAQRLDYDAFGNVLLDTAPGFQPFGFAGGLYDAQTRLVHFGARDYDPETGRWIQKDPILFAGGDTNLYGYVGNDPVNNIDPNGRGRFGQIVKFLKSITTNAFLRAQSKGLLGKYRNLERRADETRKLIERAVKKCPVDRKSVVELYAQLAALEVEKGLLANEIVALETLIGISNVLIAAGELGSIPVDKYVVDPAVEAILNPIFNGYQQAINRAGGG